MPSLPGTGIQAGPGDGEEVLPGASEGGRARALQVSAPRRRAGHVGRARPHRADSRDAEAPTSGSLERRRGPQVCRASGCEATAQLQEQLVGQREEALVNFASPSGLRGEVSVGRPLRTI